MKEFSGAVIEQAVKICGEEPCEFAAVCMGSMVRGEMTPYSDMEFLFLLENKEADVEDYFEKLVVTVYFFIENLRERHHTLARNRHVRHRVGLHQHPVLALFSPALPFQTGPAGL